MVLLLSCIHSRNFSLPTISTAEASSLSIGSLMIPSRDSSEDFGSAAVSMIVLLRLPARLSARDSARDRARLA